MTTAVKICYELYATVLKFDLNSLTEYGKFLLSFF